MVRTQIQLPDEVYARAKQVCQTREIPLAELARRGIEYILSVYAADSDVLREWHPPTPRKLGWRGLSDAEIKAEVQRTRAEETLIRTRSR
jgi:hypothetical protein